MKSSLWCNPRSKAAIYIGFAATGVALTIPGAVLPLLLHRWAMSDARGGLLLFCFYSVGSIGSYSARGRMNFSIARGSLLTSLGALCLAWAGRWSAYGAIALYGTGLSLTMTSMSLLLSQRFPAARRLEMTRLNLIWAVGAALGPWIALRSTGASLVSFRAIVHAQHVLAGVAIFFIATAVWAAWVEQPGKPEPSLRIRSFSGMRNSMSSGIREIPWQILVLIFGATGVDAAAGGWLTSYAQRAGDSLGVTIGAATFLWVGAFASRLVHSTPWAAKLPERHVLATSMLAMSVALGLLIAWPSGAVTVMAAALLGVATGPVYPLLIAAALRHKENSTAFAVAGVGAAVMPLLTGATSTWVHSLRAGLAVPLLSAAGMFGLIAASKAVLSGHREKPAAEAVFVSMV